MTPAEFTVAIDSLGSITARHFPATTADAPLVVLAHGAGADQRHRFMVTMATALATRGVAVVTFNFLYKERRGHAPDRPPVLEQTWRTVLDAAVELVGTPRRVVVGGKSMGGRIASQVLATHPDSPAWRRVAGLLLLGYPLHPSGRPTPLRAAHLPAIRVPILLVQGSRDTFGTREEVLPLFQALKVRVEFDFIEGGDHSFAVPKSAGRSEREVLDSIADRAATWIAALPPHEPGA
jgi:uncharacterized protein